MNERISSFFPAALTFLLDNRNVRYASFAAGTLYASLQFLHGQWGLLDFLVPSIRISDTHVMYPAIRDWTSRELKNARRLQAVPSNSRRQEEPEEQNDRPGRFHAGKHTWRYEPFDGRHWFCYDGHWVFLQRTESDGTWPRQGKKEEFIFKSIHWSSQHLKDMLEAIGNDDLAKGVSRTTIYYPRDSTRMPGMWEEMASRPGRTLESVILDDEKKGKLLEDIDLFFGPGRRKYYANRGIPWRRGYLFYGPPGTGKTSLALAVAANYGLSVYVLPLADPGITDASISLFLQRIRQPSLLLLEDIDSAGFVLDQAEKKTDDSEPEKQPGGRLTRTGLINAIDGVATPEGYILVMTTNNRDKLDPATTRKGRVDIQLELPLATKEDAQQMFMRMYSDDTDIEELAKSFTDAIPENKVSAAEIQGFLIVSKDPQQASHGAGKWIDQTLRMKQTGASE